MQFQMARPEQVRRAEWAVCLGATLAAIGLHVIYLTHAGGLWRDETNSIHIATSATAGEVWRMQAYVWGRQTEHFIVAHGGRTEVVPIGSGDHVSLYEKSSLAVVKGWALTSEPVR
jgi:hypothetical protein